MLPFLVEYTASRPRVRAHDNNRYEIPWATLWPSMVTSKWPLIRP